MTTDFLGRIYCHFSNRDREDINHSEKANLWEQGQQSSSLGLVWTPEERLNVDILKTSKTVQREEGIPRSNYSV